MKQSISNPIVAVNCPRCGSSCSFPSGMSRTTCAYCGSQLFYGDAYIPTSVDSLVHRAEVHLSNYDFDRARKAYLELIDLHPDYYYGWAGMIKVETCNYTVRVDPSYLYNYLIRVKDTAPKEIFDKEYSDFCDYLLLQSRADAEDSIHNSSKLKSQYLDDLENAKNQKKQFVADSWARASKFSRENYKLSKEKRLCSLKIFLPLFLIIFQAASIFGFYLKSSRANSMEFVLIMIGIIALIILIGFGPSLFASIRIFFLNSSIQKINDSKIKKLFDERRDSIKSYDNKIDLINKDISYHDQILADGAEVLTKSIHSKYIESLNNILFEKAVH